MPLSRVMTSRTDREDTDSFELSEERVDAQTTPSVSAVVDVGAEPTSELQAIGVPVFREELEIEILDVEPRETKHEIQEPRRHPIYLREESVALRARSTVKEMAKRTATKGRTLQATRRRDVSLVDERDGSRR